MLNMQRLAIFVAVVEAKSFTAAASTLGLTKAVVSFNIKQLEQTLNVSLLVRSTRQLSVTEAGERFYHHCQQLLYHAECVLNDVRADHSGLSGLLRITTTAEYGEQVVVPALAAFAQLHQQLRIQHVTSSKNDDLIAGRFDVAIRHGQLVDSNHHAKLIEQFDILPIATPAYLATLSTSPLTSLDQLAEVNWIAHSRLPTPLSWQVSTPTQAQVLFQAKHPARLVTDSAASLLAFVKSGAGVALLPAWLVEQDLEQGHLVHLLPDYHFPRQGIYALYPNTRHVPEKVRTFIDFFQGWVKRRAV